MESIKLAKAWGGHKAGARLLVLGDGLSLCRDGTVVNAAGRQVRGAAVDAARAEQLRRDGFVRVKKAAREVSDG